MERARSRLAAVVCLVGALALASFPSPRRRPRTLHLSRTRALASRSTSRPIASATTSFSATVAWKLEAENESDVVSAAGCRRSRSEESRRFNADERSPRQKSLCAHRHPPAGLRSLVTSGFEVPANAWCLTEPNQNSIFPRNSMRRDVAVWLPRPNPVLASAVVLCANVGWLKAFSISIWNLNRIPAGSATDFEIPMSV